jgi:hypothetical protein
VRLKAAVESLLGHAEFTERLRACGYQRFNVTAPEHLQGNRIANEVFRELDKADLVVLDLSSRPGTTAPSPNVMYELALVHALGLPFMLISSTTDPAPFYVAHDRVRHAAYDKLDATAAELHGPFAALPGSEEPAELRRQRGVQLLRRRRHHRHLGRRSLAAGYYDNFVHRVLREGNGYLARSGGRFKRLITVLPADLDTTAQQQIEDVEALVTSLGLQLESTELKLADSDIRGLAVRHVGSLLIDVPSTVFALRRSPRLLKHLQASRDGFEDDPGDAERKTHQRLLRQFRQSLLDHLRRDRALTPIRDKAFECVGVADLAERLRQPLA